MNILALDLGTRCGWCYWNGQRAYSGTADFSMERGESVGMRYVKFNRWLAENFAGILSATDLIIYEAAHHRGGAATQVLTGLETRVHEFCALAGIQHVSLHTGTLKKYATGHGNASKEEMILACAQRWGCGLLESNDEADARMLLAYALMRYAPTGKVAAQAPGSGSSGSTS